jgi:hypothetical protein
MIRSRPRMRLRLLAAAAAAALAVLALATPAMASPASTSGPVPGAPASVHFSGNTQLVHVLHNSHLPRTHLPKGPHAVGRVSNITQVNSRNWSGYADQACGSCALRFVNVSFAAPSINCTGVTTDGTVAASFWDGLDGFTSNSTTVEQVGVVAFCNLTTPVYAAFFEMFPQAPFMFAITGFGAGDAVNVSVYFDGTAKRYHIAFNDYTQGVFMNTVQACPSGSVCRNNSAEVIAEDPLLVSSTGTISFAPLANFGQAFYSTATVTARDGMHGNLGDTSLWSSNRLNMVNSSHVLAFPGGLLNGFTTVPVSDFTDTWHAPV